MTHAKATGTFSSMLALVTACCIFTCKAQRHLLVSLMQKPYKLEYGAAAGRACLRVSPKASRPARKHILATCSTQPCTSFSSEFERVALAGEDKGMLCTSRKARAISTVTSLAHGPGTCANCNTIGRKHCCEPAMIPQRPKWDDVQSNASLRQLKAGQSCKSLHSFDVELTLVS